MQVQWDLSSAQNSGVVLHFTLNSAKPPPLACGPHAVTSRHSSPSLLSPGCSGLVLTEHAVEAVNLWTSTLLPLLPQLPLRGEPCDHCTEKEQLLPPPPCFRTPHLSLSLGYSGLLPSCMVFTAYGPSCPFEGLPGSGPLHLSFIVFSQQILLELYCRVFFPLPHILMLWTSFCSVKLSQLGVEFNSAGFPVRSLQSTCLVGEGLEVSLPVLSRCVLAAVVWEFSMMLSKLHKTYK